MHALAAESASTSSGEDRDVFRNAVWPSDVPTPMKVVTCRFCGQKNRVEVPTAVLYPEHHTCGECAGQLFLSSSEPLTRISPAAYLHSLDRKSLLALDAIPGIPQLTRWLLSRVGDRSTRLLLMSTAVLCGEDQFPEAVELLDQARTSLDIPVRPELFLGESPHMNAVSIGFGDPMIVLHSALLDPLSDEELVAVLGHELGHLHPRHHVYHTLAQLILFGGASAFGAVVLTWPLRIALLRWQRASELTADRASLLACRSLPTCIRLMLKFAGGNRPGTHKRTSIQLAPFIRQARVLAKQESSDWIDSLLATWITANRTHPFVAWRVMHLIRWVEHGRYLDILAGQYPREMVAPVPDQITVAQVRARIGPASVRSS